MIGLTQSENGSLELFIDQAVNPELSDESDMEKVQELVMAINERVIRDEI